MKDNELDKVMSPSLGGGGSGWERNISNPNSQDVSMLRPVYDPLTGQWQFQFPNGSNLMAGQGGNSAIGPYRGSYRNDPAMMPPPFLRPDGGADTTSDGGSGGVPFPNIGKLFAKALPVAAALKNGVPGSGSPDGSNGSMSPELQQLLAQALKRMSSQDGLFAAVNKQAMAGLPTIYQQ